MIPKLYERLVAQLRVAEECWIAVGLINDYGVREVLKNTSGKCTPNFIVGIDLPTTPDTLEVLRKHQENGKATVYIFTEPPYFHPKLYLLNNGVTLSAFIGSANCTEGGLKNNIELSFQIDDQATCKKIKQWFIETIGQSEPLTHERIEAYRKTFRGRDQNQAADRKAARKAKELLRGLGKPRFHSELLIERLREFRSGPKYNLAKSKADEAVAELREHLGFSTGFRERNMDEFLRIKVLGTIVFPPKSIIEAEHVRFVELLNMLCDDDIDIAQRYTQATEGKYKIKRVGPALITKVLTIHKPTEYFVANAKSTDELAKYGIRWDDNGDGYKAACNLLNEIRHSANIPDLAVLDQCLWLMSGGRE